MSLHHELPIRRADSDDAEAVGQMLHRCNIEFHEPTPGPEVLAKRVGVLLDAGDEVMVAGDPPAGYVVLRYRQAIWAEALECYVAELWVEGPRRGEGLGRALMECAIESARGRGSAWIDLGTEEDDREARNLYESLGFVNRPGGPGTPVSYFYELDLEREVDPNHVHRGFDPPRRA